MGGSVKGNRRDEDMKKILRVKMISIYSFHLWKMILLYIAG